MSKQLFVNNANAVPAASGSVNDPSELAEARVGFFDADDFASGTLDLTSANTASRLLIAQGAKSGEEPIISSLIDVGDIEDYYEKSYVAPVSQVSTVTVQTGTGYATVRLVRVDPGYYPNERITKTVKLDGKSANAIAVELAAAINAGNEDWITASDSTADLVLTGSTGVSFETSLDDEAAGWNLAATTAPKFGLGTSAQLKNIEELAYGGNFTNRIYLPVNPPSYVVDGETYDIFTIRVKTNTTPNISKANAYQEIIIAVQATASGIDLATFFG